MIVNKWLRCFVIINILLFCTTAWAQMRPIATTPAPNPLVLPKSLPKADAILTALRHSIREDHTRVVLEFSSDIKYSTEFKDKVFRLVLTGCKNLVPTNKSDPVGRDIAKLFINSGPDRSGLILTFHLNQAKIMPLVESIVEPFRLIISVPAGEYMPNSAITPPPVTQATLPVAQTSPSAAPTTAIPVAPTTTPTAEQPTKPSTVQTAASAATSAVEQPPEINITVAPAKLENQEFLGRTVVIDAGHGGSDFGAVAENRPKEKDLNLSVALKLYDTLKKYGFRAVLIRGNDSELSQSQRIAIANKNGGDLYISLHTGFSADGSKHGVACYHFDPVGYYVDGRAAGAGYDAVFNEWIKTTRFDLALYLAKKINERLTGHLNTKSRGVRGLPLQSLKFIMNPAVLVEIGMLSDSIDGKNLLSEKYLQAIADSIANAVVDFFNGIVVR
ncbi:MAG: N-acetylmuramoyl-L-alanine amidase [Candidatus Riflebacteria bacterium]|nr:N-acetylmuramoyl-L-alanine amidase [Candidatus Riflebacteria bacterium]